MPPIDQYVSSRQKDPRSTAELIRAALSTWDEDAAWQPVTVLHCRGTREVLEAAHGLCKSHDSNERWLGAAILGQLGIPERTFPNECFLALSEMLNTEADPEVLQAVGVALGHLNDPRSVARLVPFKNHPSADVRFGVVLGISGLEDDVAISTLIELSTDSDDEVRNWATTGLGSFIPTDSPAIRDALAKRMEDPHDETKGEALVGLARRKDPRVIDPLIKALTEDTVGSLTVDAAEELGDPRLYPALIRLKEWWDVYPETLNRALKTCEPHHP